MDNKYNGEIQIIQDSKLMSKDDNDHKKVLILASVASMIDKFNMNNIDILEQLGYEVHVLCNFTNGSITSQERVYEFRSELSERGIKAFNVLIPRELSEIKNIIHSYKQIKKIVEKEQYSIVHCHSPIGGALARLGCRMIRQSGAKIIYTAHGFHFFKGAPLLNWLVYYPVEKLLAKYTNILITINKEDYKRAKTKFKTKKIEYISGIGIDIDKINHVNVDKIEKRREISIDVETIVLLSVGEVNKNKNHEVVIRAISRLKNLDIVYIIVGLGNLDEYLVELAEQHGVKDKLILLGYRNDVLEICKIADMFIFPSLREGLSVSLMEAMVAGLPVICSDIRGNTDLIKNGMGGYLVKANDDVGYARNILKLASDKNLRIKMGSFNTKRIKMFGLEVVNKRMTEIYKNINN